jgi:hypothetical protein
MTTTTALVSMGVLGGIGVAIDAAAGLSAREAMSERGIFAPRLLRTGWKRWLDGRASRPLSALFGYPQVLTLFVAQLVGASALLAVPWLSGSLQAVVGALGAAVVLGARMLLHARIQLGNDGSDQMMLVVVMSVLVGWLTIGTPIAVVAVWYAALQLLLSYLVAGIAKLSSATWRRGSAVPAILNTVGLGWPALARTLRRHHVLSFGLCWSVIAFECLMPATVLLGSPGIYVVLACGLAFHVGIAVTMGLGTFLWAFAGAYPALLLLAEKTAVV